jgi:hypothetical protein
MKNLKVLTKCILGFVILGLVMTSCSDNDDNTAINNETQDIAEIQQSAEIDQIDNVLGDIVVEVYEQQEGNLGRMANASSASFIPECVTITVVAQQNFREVTVDFGTEGCVVQGHLLRGQIVFDYTRDPEAQQIEINYNLVDFFVDAKNVIGSRSILRELANDNGNPQFTHDLSLTVIWPNGVQASREGTRIREWVEGFGSGVFSDNVFEITGDWTATFVNGNTHSYEVVIPLRREIGCMYFVSGSVDVERTNFGGIFDFGDGTCDDQATFTFNNGTEIEVQL